MAKDLRVELLISDPWEFGTEFGVGPFGGTVLGRRGDELAVILDRPFRYRGCLVAGLVMAPRHAEPKDPWGNPLVDPVSVSAVPFMADDASLGAEEVFEAIDRWRGWGFIGSVQIMR